MIFRSLNMAVMVGALAAVGTTAAYAQDACGDIDGQTAAYTKFTELFPKKSIADRKATIEAGKQFLEKYGTCESVKEQADYLKGAIPKMEEGVKNAEGAAVRSEILKRYDAGIQGKKWDEAYAAGGEFVAKYPNDPAEINIIVPLGLIGLVETENKNTKYNAETLKYANRALALFKNNVKSTKDSGNFGVFQFEGTRDNTVADLTYAIGYITFYDKKDRKGALPSLFEVTKTARYKNDPRVYATIGSYYIDESAPIGQGIQTLINEQKAATTPEDKLAKENAIKEKISVFNGYTERAIDAYARAAAAAKAETPAQKAYKDELNKIVEELYVRRFEKKDGLPAYVASAVAKPFVDPTTPVQPVADPEPAKTDVDTTTSAPAADTAKPAPTKPVSSVPAKAAVKTVKKTR